MTEGRVGLGGWEGVILGYVNKFDRGLRMGVKRDRVVEFRVGQTI